MQILPWAFGNFAPCSLVLGSLVFLPSKTVVYKTVREGFPDPPVLSRPRYPGDHQYVKYDPDLRADVYYPDAARFAKPSSGAGWPVFIYFHGGGWRYGDRKRDIPGCTFKWLLDRGVAVVSPDYRLTQHGFNGTQIVGDCFDFIRFLNEYGAGDELGLDMARSVSAGNSAGGHLAMMVGYAMRNETTVKGVVDLWGVEPGADAAAFAERKKSFHGGDPSYFSPSSHVGSASPPTLIVHGVGDSAVPLAASETVAAALSAAGVKHQMVAIPGQNHACDVEAWGSCSQAIHFTLQYFLADMFN